MPVLKETPPENPDLVDVYYQESSRCESMSDHFHYRHELIYVGEGSVEFLINGQPETAHRHSLVIIGHLEQHNIKVTQSPYNRYVLSMSNDLCLQMIREPLLLSLLIHRPGTASHVFDLEETAARKIERIFQELIEERDQQRALWLTWSAMRLMEILMLVYRQNPSVLPGYRDESAVQTVIRVQRHIAVKFSERIILEELADSYFISKYHLSRIFREVTGYGFKDYLILYRLNEAKKLLRDTNKPVTEICYAIGYGNVNHFIRIFRSHEGTSPPQYRKHWSGTAKPDQPDRCQ